MDPYEISLFTALVIVLVTVLLVIGTLLTFFMRRQRRYRQRIKQQARGEVSRTEEALERLSMDLHDDLRSLVTSVRIQLMLLDEGEQTANAVACVDQLGERLQEISRNLSPRLLAIKGLHGALESLIKTVQAGGLPVAYTYVLQQEPASDTRIQLYRIVQELLQNAVKHADAKKVWLRLEETKRQIRLLYRDDGKGFRYKEEHSGFGLRNLRSRTELLDGHMQCWSAPGRGTHYLFQLPKR